MSDRRSSHRQETQGQVILDPDHRRVRLPLADLSVTDAYSPLAPQPRINHEEVLDVEVRVAGFSVRVPACTVYRPRHGSRLHPLRCGVLLNSPEGGFSSIVERVRGLDPVFVPDARTTETHRKLIEQLLSSIASIDQYSSIRTRLLLTLFVSLLLLAAAPYLFTRQIEPGQTVAFSAVGVAAVICVFVISNHLFKTKCHLVKDKARYFKQVNLSRKCLLANDPNAWRWMVLPLDDDYVHYSSDDVRRPASDYSTRQAIPLVYIVLNGLTLVLFYYFLGYLLWRPEADAGGGRTGDVWLDALTKFAFLAPILVHVTGENCFRYRRKVFESIMIAPENPNPDFPQPPKRTSGQRRAIAVVLALVGIGIAVAAWSTKAFGPWLPGAAMAFVVLHALLKYLDVRARVRAGLSVMSRCAHRLHARLAEA